GTLDVPSPGVLKNDAGNAPTAMLVSGPSHGTLALKADGSLSYTPAGNYGGPDSFTYQPVDAAVRGNIATVSLTVSPVNDPPVARSDTFQTSEDTPLVVPAGGVLANDADVEGTPLAASLATAPSNGLVSLNADGSFTYTPNPNFNGVDSFT